MSFRAICFALSKRSLCELASCFVLRSHRTDFSRPWKYTSEPSKILFHSVAEFFLQIYTMRCALWLWSSHRQHWTRATSAWAQRAWVCICVFVCSILFVCIYRHWWEDSRKKKIDKNVRSGNATNCLTALFRPFIFAFQFLIASLFALFFHPSSPSNSGRCNSSSQSFEPARNVSVQSMILNCHAANQMCIHYNMYGMLVYLEIGIYIYKF